ncbi:short-subunit dehydrogenase [Haloactinopolyspora alba]|uniref:Short-subunit dehydrogenase n=1 Tax=Haloactinopolyspora alba TaxID=648780 RepID=A0A2P8DWC4_9ACTN|nr:SDR family NAD(P)-dependent oxidoreductase [Haloactinopolyspora alba]PSL01529.1 short-subunit dehydrogenase [Haloactinopolyspora alba]
MHDETVLITGGTGGIGRQTARGLADLGKHVVLVGRDPERAARAAGQLRHESGTDRVDALTADVSRQSDLRRLTDQVTDRYGKLDALINNAGSTKVQRELTEDRVETVFATNVVAPFLLTHLLLPALRAAPRPRVVNITGGVPRGHINVENLQGQRSYAGLSFYNQTKLALMAMSITLAGRLGTNGVAVNVAYPGHASTAMNKGLPISTYPLAARPIVPLLKLLSPLVLGNRAAVRASRSSIRLVSDPGLDGITGVYIDRKARPARWPEAVLDAGTRRAVWQECERVTNRSW